MKKLIFCSLICVVMIFFSCQDDQSFPETVPEQSFKSEVPTELSDSEAEQILMNFIEKRNSLSIQTRGNNVTIRRCTKNYCSSPQTKSTGEIAEAVAFYNFELLSNNQEGYAIVCGDKRLPQVLAYSTNGSLERVKSSGNEFLVNYLSNLPDAITKLLENRKGLADLNNRYTAGFSYEDVPNVAHTYETDSTVERVVYLQESTTWEQGAPYNNLMDINPKTNQRYLVGCSNIACVNIMAYYCYPEKYNWAALKEFRAIIEGYQPASLVTQAAQLCKDIFIANKSVNTENGTGTKPSDVITGLRSFGYETSGLLEYSLDSIKASLEKFYPVYMRGQDPKKTIGHAFVVRGYWKVLPKSNLQRDSTVSIGINWGWMGGFGDGFYLAEYDDVDLTILGLHPLVFGNEGPVASKDSYTDKIKLITRIRPKGY